MARRMWQALESLHMTVYFSPEPRDAYRRPGLRGGLDPSGRPLYAAHAALPWPLPPWRRLGDGGCGRLLELLGRPVKLVVEGGGVPFPNPVGLPAPTA